MPSPSNKPIEPNLSNIEAPPRGPRSPGEQFQDEVRAEVKKRTDEIFNRTFRYFTTGGGASLPIFQDIVTHDKSKYTKPEYNDAVKGFIEKVQTSTITPANPAMRPPPLFTTAHIAAHPYATTLPATLPISQVEANLADILHAHLEQGIHDAIHAAIKEFNQSAARQQKLNEAHAADRNSRQMDPALAQLLKQQQELQQQSLQQQAKQQEQPPKTPEQVSADKIRGEIGELLRPSKALSQKDIYKWIESGLDLAKDKERLVEKLKNTGLINYSKRTTTDPDTNQETTSYKIYAGNTKSGYFQGLRAGSFVAWGATIGLSALALVAAPAGAGGLAVALGAVGVVNAVNAGIQSFLKWRHTNTFTNTWKEIQSELGTMDPKRAPALSGLMYLLVDKYSPIYLFPNRTNLFQLGQPSSTGAVLDHLKEAAFAALNNVAGTTEGYYKGVDVKEKLSLAKTGLDNLEKRWGWHWGASTWWASTITTTSFLGALGYGASAFL